MSATFFLCPDGDLHTIKPAESIWIERSGPWWRRSWTVFLQWVGDDGPAWEWEADTLKEAQRIRYWLISALISSPPIDPGVKLKAEHDYQDGSDGQKDGSGEVLGDLD